MSTRSIRGEEAAAAAEIVRLVQERPVDLIDPFPPSTEIEILVDSGSRGKAPDAHPRVAYEGDRVVGYGALDFSTDLPWAVLVGPVVHPAFRRKGHGRRLLEDLLGQGRAQGRSSVRAMIGAENRAAHDLLKEFDFKEKGRATCLRVGRPLELPLGEEMKNVRVRQSNYDHAAEIHEYARHFVPRSDRQTRSLLKSGDYLIFTARRKQKLVGFLELDLRFGRRATVQKIGGDEGLLRKGLGTMLLAEAFGAAFQRRRVREVEFLLPGTNGAAIESCLEAGCLKSHELVSLRTSL